MGTLTIFEVVSLNCDISLAPDVAPKRYQTNYLVFAIDPLFSRAKLTGRNEYFTHSENARADAYRYARGKSALISLTCSRTTNVPRCFFLGNGGKRAPGKETKLRPRKEVNSPQDVQRKEVCTSQKLRHDILKF